MGSRLSLDSAIVLCNKNLGNIEVDYDSYAELQKSYPRTISNDYMLPDGLIQRFLNGTLTVSADDRALFMFERREGFTKLYFRLLDVSAALAPQEDTLAAFLVYRENRSPEIAVDWLLSQGFVKTRTLKRHTTLAITGDLSPTGIERASADEAYAMFGKYFSAVEVDLPCQELFEGAFCVRSQDGTIAGVIHLGQRPALAVAPEARRQGIGRMLYRAYAATKVRDGQKPVFHAWISPDNTGSLAMFERLGFTADNVLTECYVKY